MGKVKQFLLCSFSVAGLAQTPVEVLEQHCQGCHGGQQALSQLDVRTRASLLKGGTRGAAVVPGDAEKSLLLHVLEGRSGLQMPPGGPAKKLAPEVIAAVRSWINAGAVWPEKASAPKWNFKPEDLWALQPLRPFDASRTIDSFLKPTPAADRRTLIRRITIDLTGLPPTPEEVEAFVKDKSPKAYATLIDRLLASPRYGERWGRHWLDVARYADTGGYSNDFERPNAWRYRDYVVRSFNQDKPYHQFIREQLAGDELYPGNTEALIATGFLRSGPWEHTGMSVEAVTRQLFLDDVTHATASTFLGLTLGCAKCHDHKFDPLPTRDYYRMQAVFASTEFARPAAAWLPSESTAGFDVGAARVKEKLEYNRRRAAELKGVKKGEEYEEFKLHQKHAQLFQESMDRYSPKAFAVSSGPLDGATDGGPNLKYPKAADYKPAVVHVLPGGNIQSPAEAVTPGVLSLVERYSGYPAPVIPETAAGRRSALAQWIADERNPLTARVMVNRVWQYHFGQGIAGDTSNFGRMGKKPSQPELLDHLAQAFMRNGWSVKQLHRQILLSAAYQSASLAPRRVEAEVLRDSILAVAGELSLDAGGPGVFPQINEDVARQPQHRMGSLAPAYQVSPRKRDRNRRTIYTFQQRSLIDPLVDVFNGPGLDLSCDRRETSTVPTQAFALLNSQFASDMALAFAARVERDAPSLEARIRRAFALAYGRAPSAAELAQSRQHVLAMTGGNAIAGQPTPDGARAARAALEESVELLRSGEIAAVVTGPIHKARMQAIGYEFPGQTEFYARRAGVENFAMCLTGGALTVALVTAHVPLKDVATLLTAEEIVRVGKLLSAFLTARFGREPRIAVAGLNPHAGESGTLGREEIEIIAPAIEQLGNQKFLGPISPDTVFNHAVAGEFDGVLCMYHDQGLIPLKLHAFDQGVNVTLGLPFPRTSPDHGTAFEIAGKNIARPDSMIAAIRLAAELSASQSSS